MVMMAAQHWIYWVVKLKMINFIFYHHFLNIKGAAVVSDSVRPHRRQPTRLPRPWDSPGKNTGVGCHVLLQCMKVKSKSEVSQSCLTLQWPHGLQPTRLLRPWDFPGKSAIAFSEHKGDSGLKQYEVPLNSLNWLVRACLTVAHTEKTHVG